MGNKMNKAKRRLQERIDAWEALPSGAAGRGGKTKIVNTMAFHRPGSQKK